jgi:outer membrane lipoprotein carrier protein
VRVWILLLCGLSPVFALDILKVLKGVENRYNRAATLQLTFSESYTFQGRPRPAESGELFLRKPGKMRWQYRKPAGKLFLSDGQDVYYYNPAAQRVERMKLKEAGDLHAPLAFLLGKLDFQRDFREFRHREEGSALWVTAIPKSDKSPYKEVSFLVALDSRIERVKVLGQDNSILEFQFAGETVNPALAEALFRFSMPEGAEFIDVSKGGQ